MDLKGTEFIDLSKSESPRFVGKAIVALTSDRPIKDKSANVLRTSELALEYGFTDE